MNPIENLWAIVERRRDDQFDTPKNQAELIDQIFTIWEQIDDELLVKLSGSVTRRLESVIEMKGKTQNIE